MARRQTNSTKTRQCSNCGRPYEVCMGCKARNHWSQVTCSMTCFRDWNIKKEEERKAKTALQKAKQNEKVAQEVKEQPIQSKQTVQPKPPVQTVKPVQEQVKPQPKTEIKTEVKADVKATKEGKIVQGVLLNRKKHNITEYNLTDGTFVCADGVTRNKEEFKEFILSYDEMIEIYEM